MAAAVTAPAPALAAVAPQDATMAALRAMGGNEWLWVLAWVHATDPGLVAGGLAALAADRQERAEAARKRRNRKATLRSRRSRQRRQAAA